MLRFGLSNAPLTVERWYSRGIFNGIRTILDFTIGWLPIPGLYCIGGIALLFGLARLLRKGRPRRSPLSRLLHFAFAILNFCCLVIAIFLALWGFNYARQPLVQQMDIQAKPLSIEATRIVLDRQTAKAFAARKAVAMPLSDEIGHQLKDTIRQSVKDLLRSLNYPNHGLPRLHILWPKGTLLHISTAGFYSPWTGECHVDGGLHPLDMPFVIAHEYFHAYGFTDEGICNFLAYLACRRSTHPALRYSAELNYWQYLAGSYRRLRPDEYRSFYYELPEEIKDDLKAMREYLDRYPDILPKVRNMVYDTYLKSQGITEGLENYNKIVMLVEAWREKESIKD